METRRIGREFAAFAPDNRPEASTEERRVSDLIKRDRKLRWMGMDDAADALIRTQGMSRANISFLAVPADTD